MAEKILYSKAREKAGNTSNSDRYLDYYIEEDDKWKIPDGHKVTSYLCSITKIKSASGDFPTFSPDNGNATVIFEIEYTDNSSTNMKFVFTGSNQITTTAKTITTSLPNINITGKTIEHFKLYYAEYAGTDKDIKCETGSYVTLTINYEESARKVDAPSNVKFASTEVAPNQTVKLTWNAPSNLNGNTSVTYTIYQKNSDGTSTKIDTTTSTEYNKITSPATNGASKTYYVTAKGNLETSEVISANEATLTTIYTAVNGVSDVYINNKSSIYVGSTNTPTLTLTWAKNPNPHGVNNTLQKFEIYKDNKLIDSVGANTTQYPVTAAGVYQIKAIGQYANSGLSTTSATLTFINSPSQPTISNYATKVGSNVSYTWTNTTSSNNYEISYTFSCIKKGETTAVYSTKTTNNSLSFPVSSYINEGQTYTITITTTLTATDGGTTSNSWTSNEITRITQFQFNKTWKYYYDPKFSNADKPLAYVWSSVQVGWNAATAIANSGTNFKYDLYYCIGETANWGAPLKTKLTNTAATIDITNVEAGSTIQIYVKATDEYGVEATTNVLKLYKINRPSLTTISFNSINYNSINFSFNWGINTNYTKNLLYSCELCYDNSYKNFITNQNLGHTLSSDKTTTTISINLNEGASAAAGSFYGKLYTKVITNKYAKPVGKLRITAYYEGIPECSATIEKDFSYNFITSFSTKPNLTINSQKTFYNPGDKYTITITAPTWNDAVGGQTGADLTYTLTGNNKRETLSGTETSYDDTAPAAEKDTPLNYEITATLSWKDASVSTTINSPLIVNIARWTSNDSVTLSGLKRANKAITGNLNIAGTLCGSSAYDNISSVTYNIYIVNEPKPKLEDQKFEATKSPSTISKTFTFSDETETEVSVYAVVTFINSSGASIEKTTSIFLIRPEGVPLAIRKGRVGINVNSKKFTIGLTEDNSALHVTALNDYASVLDLEAINGKTFLKFFQAGSLFTSFYKDNNNYLACDALNAVKKTGDTMTGRLAISEIWFPSLMLSPTDANQSGTYTAGMFEASYMDNVSMWVYTDKTNASILRRGLVLYGHSWQNDTNLSLVLRECDSSGTWLKDRYILHSDNYTSYTVKKDGTGATGTWAISISGTATNAYILKNQYNNYYLNIDSNNGIPILFANDTNGRSWAIQRQGTEYEMQAYYYTSGEYKATRVILSSGNYSSYALPLVGGTLTGKVTTSYTSGTWINSVNGGSAINLTGTSYTGWISGNGKTGKFVISTYPAQTDLLYFGFKLNTTIESGVNSLDKKMTWNGTTGELVTEGAISANIVKGNAIRYSSTTPTTNLAVGQIWLKPKN